MHIIYKYIKHKYFIYIYTLHIYKTWSQRKSEAFEVISEERPHFCPFKPTFKLMEKEIYYI